MEPRGEIPSPHGDLMVRIDPQTCEVDPQHLAPVRRWREIEDRVSAFTSGGFEGHATSAGKVVGR